ncbi:hypothetical protein Psuf_071200 [Phytohabitans suffuscus]|uniref:Uncharacterized protein n=1 Tax=Phytohabitans suffuscus TaxID=624315 RepID=A0A6F8YUJ3_9ACTN|nr:hypothetical protein Psuf_071200 [Phytohabitans suffuscus]
MKMNQAISAATTPPARPRPPRHPLNPDRESSQETFRGQGPSLSTVASVLPLVCPLDVETGRRFEWIVVWIRPYGGSFIPRSVAGSRAFEGRGGVGAEFAWFVLLVRVIVDLGGPMRTEREAVRGRARGIGSG